MDFIIDVVVHRPLQAVLALFDDPPQMLHWMPSLIRCEHLSGEENMPGARYRLTFHRAGRTFVLIKVLTEKNLPQSLTATYETGGMITQDSTTFLAVSPNATRIVSTQTVTFKGVFRWFGWLFLRAYEKQGRSFLLAFKKFAEQTG